MFRSLSEKVRTAGKRSFFERRIEIRVGARALTITLSRRRQILLLFLLFVGAAAAGWAGIGDLSYSAQLRARQAEARQTAAANTALRDYAARLRQKLTQTARALAEVQTRIAARERAVETVRSGLASAEQQLRRLQSAAPAGGPPAHAALAGGPASGQIARLAQALTEAKQQQQTAAAQRAAIASRLAAAQSDLDRAAARADSLKLALARLTARLQGIGQQPTAQSAVLRVAPAPGLLGRVARTLTAAGIDARRIFASFGIRRDVGGPFIPVRDAPTAAQMAAEQTAVQTMLKTLPVYAPLAHYRETSPFGPRVDPINDRHGFHPGVDLAAPYGTPVYATAPGTVTYAGWEDGYGKIVRIDHGHGLSTGYAHLHRYTVVVGEKVAAGTVVGYVGTTGRTTGPHVHYEVRLNNVPVNPAGFLALGREIAADKGAIIAVAAR